MGMFRYLADCGPTSGSGHGGTRLPVVKERLHFAVEKAYLGSLPAGAAESRFGETLEGGGFWELFFRPSSPQAWRAGAGRPEAPLGGGAFCWAVASRQGLPHGLWLPSSGCFKLRLSLLTPSLPARPPSGGLQARAEGEDGTQADCPGPGQAVELQLDAGKSGGSDVSGSGGLHR